jgi:hypothetical protein
MSACERTIAKPRLGARMLGLTSTLLAIADEVIE